MSNLKSRLEEIRERLNSRKPLWDGYEWVTDAVQIDAEFLLSIIEEWERALRHIEGELRGEILSVDGEHTGHAIKSPPDTMARYALAKAEELASK